ncbi:MAG: DUF1329 domain-containing protein [Mariprofundaceae bacterium]
MNAKNAIITACTILASTLAYNASAAITSEEAARLDADLTPLGAIRAGNSDGSIPAWKGGITSAPEGYKPGMHHPDPFATDKPLFTITQKNVAQYTDKLTAGHQALIATYPESYKLNIYPTHRSASFPPRIYEATKRIATTAKLTKGGNFVDGAIEGIPFPIPANGQEAIWNHLLRYRGDAIRVWIGQATPSRGGDYTMVRFETDFNMNYSKSGATVEKLNNTIIHFKQKVTAPPRLAGSILLVHETLDQISDPRKAWVYNTGLRRVRRAPNVAYDNPGTASDGMRTGDQFDMFNGALDRYDWELVGRKEMYVPYNAYKLHSDRVKIDDIITPLHINQDLPRYELHRVWIVEAKLKEGTNHIYSRRTFYLDEDSWQIVAVDQYDGRGELWRVSEGHAINYYDVPTFWTTLEVHTDLQAGRYLALGLDNDSKMYDFSATWKDSYFTPAALRREGRR